MHFLALFHTAFPLQPPPLRGTSFHRKEGVSTRAPSLGRGCRAQRGGVGFIFGGEAASSLPSPLGKALYREKRYPRFVAFPIGEGFISGIALLSYRSLPHRGRGTASAVDRVLSLMAHLRRSSSLFFMPLVPYPARSARHLPHEGRLCFGNTAIPIQPPPLRGTSFQRKEGECRIPIANPFPASSSRNLPLFCGTI